jgi:uncharacterized protein (TIGR02270 family)
LLDDDELSLLAGEAFCAITGFDPAKAEKKERPEEPEQPPPLEQDDLDADLVPGPEAALPQLDPEKVAAWWRTAEKRFDAKVRYLGGELWSPQAFSHVLRQGSTRRRHALAFAVAVRSKGRIDISTRAWSQVQRIQLAEVDRWASIESTQPITRVLS